MVGVNDDCIGPLLDGVTHLFVGVVVSFFKILFFNNCEFLIGLNFKISHIFEKCLFLPQMKQNNDPTLQSHYFLKPHQYDLTTTTTTTNRFIGGGTRRVVVRVLVALGEHKQRHPLKVFRLWRPWVTQHTPLKLYMR